MIPRLLGQTYKFAEITLKTKKTTLEITFQFRL